MFRFSGRLVPGKLSVPRGQVANMIVTATAITAVDSQPTAQNDRDRVPHYALRMAMILNSASNLNFGTQGVLAANVDQTSTITVTCTNTTPYNIGLDKGVNGGSVTTRQMKAAGPALINYSLFSDAGRTVNWGQTIGTDTVAATGTGSAQPFTVFGRIPPQPSPLPAVYNDTITVTVTY